MNIAKVCDISSWSLRNLGLLEETGFTTEIQMKDSLVAECVLLTNHDLDTAEIELEEQEV